MDKRNIFNKNLWERLYSIVIFLLVSGIFCSLAGCSYTPEPQTTATTATDTQELNWQLKGKWISEDGTVYESAACSISGTIQFGEDGEDILDLSITFTEGCSYEYINPFSCISQSRKYLKVPYCVSPYYSFNKDLSDFVFSHIGISLDEEFAIFHWEDKENLYLVLSTDPDSYPMDILTYFAAYVQTYTQ